MKRKMESKTIRFQILMGMLGTGLGMIQMLEQFLAPEMYTFIFMAFNMVFAGGNVYLRTITTEPVQ